MSLQYQRIIDSIVPCSYESSRVAVGLILANYIGRQHKVSLIKGSATFSTI